MRFYFQAQGLPRPAMYNGILFLFVNALLNYIFVFGGPFRHLAAFGNWQGFGFVGGAISLSISRTLQSIVYFLYMFVYKKHHEATWPGLSMAHHTRARTIEFLLQALPGVGTILFGQCISQATTMLVSQLGEMSIAASSAVSTVFIPWSGTIFATGCTISAVRVGYHLGKGDGQSARKTKSLVLCFSTAIFLVISAVFLPLKDQILKYATNDHDVLDLSSTVVLAVLVQTYLNLIVTIITDGVFSGMGRPIIATILSFGFELPISIGAVALYIIRFHGDLLGVYWVQAAAGGFELSILCIILLTSNWDKYAKKAQKRQEVAVIGPVSEFDLDSEFSNTRSNSGNEITYPL
uniref:Polysaccharide biosynthesis protein C-terminal domain-containing protein n=1 Tax=Corethron hystrix TaxID=216773 RepID=A0A6U5ETY3_9STRA|mmetsp:Transcript_19325/g.44036  ORF Transcript_19325/g.44036 Transcript_19325/m.44036 type:complete len:350 (+) Transcript_19325:772-1821(+)